MSGSLSGTERNDVAKIKYLNFLSIINIFNQIHKIAWLNNLTLSILEALFILTVAEGYFYVIIFIPVNFAQTDKFRTVDANEFEKFINDTTVTLPKDKPVALYCRSGNRSKKAAGILAENGYEVVELGTGYRGWVASGKKIDNPSQIY